MVKKKLGEKISDTELNKRVDEAQRQKLNESGLMYVVEFRKVEARAVGYRVSTNKNHVEGWAKNLATDTDTIRNSVKMYELKVRQTWNVIPTVNFQEEDDAKER